MTYLELENKLRNLKGIEPAFYQSDNFITPWVVGFIKIGKRFEYEISYGTAFGGGWCIGVTLLYNKRLLKDRTKYSKCFFDDEIYKINDFITEMKKEIKTKK